MLWRSNRATVSEMMKILPKKTKTQLDEQRSQLLLAKSLMMSSLFLHITDLVAQLSAPADKPPDHGGRSGREGKNGGKCIK